MTVEYNGVEFDRVVVNVPFCTGCTLYEDHEFVRENWCDKVNQHLEDTNQKEKTCYHLNVQYAIFVIKNDQQTKT